ncbi:MULTISPECIES: hypothetical protein [Photorhabdus]|uniref:Uncharacterized protein n=1 Tax=Photorhabdus luminescens TaxID=29488 RepID=A0A1G5R136_PHOLU|nr:MULTISPECIES: hypothetical protein [Photorhabdus]MCT8342725.1 hypothetical protein [Photorhabdus kleinii]SCZ67568.1 hypothetical protein SAMN02982990_02775 [Photorhabdus luminescens]
MKLQSARDIKQVQHKIYGNYLRQIESGERESMQFMPKSDLGQLQHSTKLKKQFSFA